MHHRKQRVQYTVWKIRRLLQSWWRTLPFPRASRERHHSISGAFRSEGEKWHDKNLGIWVLIVYTVPINEEWAELRGDKRGNRPCILWAKEQSIQESRGIYSFRFISPACACRSNRIPILIKRANNEPSSLFISIELCPQTQQKGNNLYAQ